MHRLLTRGAAVALTLATAVTMQATANAQAAAVSIPVGTGEAGYAVNLFGAEKVTVAKGATVQFKNPWFEPHTITFPGDTKLPPPSDPNAPVPTNPGQTVAYDGKAYLNSGFVLKDKTFELSFPNNGTYPYFCIIHPGMQGTIEVVDAGNAAISQQADVDAASKKTFDTALAALKQANATATAKPVQKTANADGSTTWTVVVGGLVGPSDLQQFYAAKLDIKQGDTVVWKSDVPTPHTATFLGGTALPVPPIPENPKVMQPAPAAGGYNGTGYVNSGIIGLGWPAGQQFSQKFTAAGSFPYICVLHVDQGMGGVINVAAAAAAPAPAKTGTAGLEGAPSASLALQAALVLAALGTVAAARRSMRAR
ncbi:MAG: plastocyanin/azurin family copper-binding protein [Dehalococcoidia bacterium]